MTQTITTAIAYLTANPAMAGFMAFAGLATIVWGCCEVATTACAKCRRERNAALAELGRLKPKRDKLGRFVA